MAATPVIIALNRSGEAVAHRVAALLDAPVHGRKGRVDQADAFFPNALDHVRDLFAAGTPVIGVCASGILIRAIAPMLVDKRSEPPVLSVSDDGTVVIPLLGGHRGANRLARQIAQGLEAKAAVTTSGDLALGIALDEPPSGYRLTNPEHAKDVMADLLSGAPYGLASTFDWLKPVADLSNVTPIDVPRSVAARALLVKLDGGNPRFDLPHLSYVAVEYTLGLGCARGADPDGMRAMVGNMLDANHIPPKAVAGIASLDLKADEPAMLAVADWLKVPFRLFTAAELEAETPRLATPSDVVFAEVGCHGVSEGAALALAGLAANLVVPKVKTAEATCAMAKAPAPIIDLGGRGRGCVSLIGIGPGQADWRTPEASKLISQADELVGYGLYIDLLGPLAAGKPRADFPLGGEEARCRYALEEAGKGREIALVCSGDAGIYAMGALVFELLDRGDLPDAACRVEVVSAPGVSALQAAAARAGAPLGHDFCTISLSDLLTPRNDILRRIKAAAEGDFVIAFYNPVSRKRRTLLAEAREILLGHRPADCPVLLATSLGRPEEYLRYRRLDALEVDEVDMLTVVLVGSSQSALAERGEGPRMYTPRGYAKKMSAKEPAE
ncbi:precorrin-3B C(17)-methyltransferase [Actibacterium sp. 188UL27-1]|uniref:precorrin-3B C(17)-methyltransferase n=1 Tax=Actibacterium sp. 188UL27-1 TaxID=2786961 RepID=UPI00195A64C2|nr:precorrin-3B C(17)-methyltransferase [Actibacterium sp. 188UL27-1]MBM7068622.1 precorrin-3B C(17)-methyltransferase [Actibacterium sp. 188UL27-1]